MRLKLWDLIIKPNIKIKRKKRRKGEQGEGEWRQTGEIWKKKKRNKGKMREGKEEEGNGGG